MPSRREINLLAVFGVQTVKVKVLIWLVFPKVSLHILQTEKLSPCFLLLSVSSYIYTYSISAFLLFLPLFVKYLSMYLFDCAGFLVVSLWDL